MADRIRLDGKVAIVTGAAGVIGTATIRLLAERGARIVAVDRREPDLKSSIADLPATAQALAITADVTREDEVAEYVRAAVDKFSTVDIFYNNAGIEGEIAPITNYPLETFRRVIEVNVVGVFLGLKHVLPIMLKLTGISRLSRGASMAAAMEHAHPDLPYFYLAFIAVAPSLQGAGRGSALLRQTLQRADAAGAHAYLENSNPRNLALYERAGFSVTQEIKARADAPPVYAMWRPAKSK